MKLYADLPGRRTAQIVADVFMVCWVGLCAWLGHAVADAMGVLRGPGESLDSAGQSISSNMASAADQVAGVPLIGDGLRAPFDAVAGAGGSVSSAGTSFVSAVDTLAKATGIVVAVVPILVVFVVWLFVRVRFVRRASAAAQIVRQPGAVDLLAFRALSRQPLKRLMALGPDPAGRFRAGDPDIALRLAELELRSSGVSLTRPTAPGTARPALS